VRKEIMSLAPEPPYRLDLTVWALRRRAHNMVDRWDEGAYRRMIIVEGVPVEVVVEQTGPTDQPLLQVSSASPGAADVAPALRSVLDRLLGLSVDLAGFYACAVGDPWLGPLAERFRGFRPPRFPTLFETLLNAIACQQITLALGIHLLNRLAGAYGAAPEHRGELRALPQPADLIGGDIDTLRALGYSGQKAHAMLQIAALTLEGRLVEWQLADLNDLSAVARLRELPGVGRWTAEYVLLRGLGRLHVFPGDDVGARNNLRRQLGLEEQLNYAGVREAIAPWRAYGGVVYFHLLLAALAEAGRIEA
jgi:DNA-3-methyladenine glycosylase II